MCGVFHNLGQAVDRHRKSTVGFQFNQLCLSLRDSDPRSRSLVLREPCLPSRLGYRNQVWIYTGARERMPSQKEVGLSRVVEPLDRILGRGERSILPPTTN